MKNIYELYVRNELYQLSRKLHQEGLGYKKIANYIKERYGFHVSISTIQRWVRNISNPLGRYKIPESSPELAYVIGAWLGDGTLAKREKGYEYMIRLMVKDYDFASQWGKALAKAVGRTIAYRPIWSKKHCRWLVSARNYALYSLLSVARIDPFVVHELLADFPREACRGFFDAEGSVNFDYYYVTACVNNYSLVLLFGSLLESLSIKFKVYRFGRPCLMTDPKSGVTYIRSRNFIYCLRISKKVNLAKFQDTISFTISRKRQKLKRLLERCS